MMFELATPTLIAEASPLRVFVIPLAVLGGILFAAVIASMFFMRDEKRWKTAVRWFDAGRFGTMAAVLSAVLIVMVSGAAEDSSVEAARNDWMSNTYGVSAEAKQMEKLDFPRSQPEADEAFGTSTLQTAAGKEVVVRLAWQDEGFVLLDSYGEELKRVG